MDGARMRRSQFPGRGRCLQGVSAVSTALGAVSATLLSQCLVEVVNSLVGCRAEGSASAERLLADGGEGGRDCDLSEGGAVLRKGGADSSRSVYHRLQYTIDYNPKQVLQHLLTTHLEGALPDGGEGGG